MLYWNQTVDRTSYVLEPVTASAKSPGSILVRVSDRPEITDYAKQASAEYKYIAENNPKLNVQQININGNPGWANDISPSARQQTAKFADGQVITNYYDMPARVRIFNHGKLIHLEGYVPLSELVRVAQSLH